MYLRCFIILQLVAELTTERNILVGDYFAHKNVPQIVGLLCKNSEDDIPFLRTLNSLGISVATKKSWLNLDVKQFANTDVRSVGVFLDLRCQGQNATFILSESAKYDMYSNLYSWLILGPSLNRSVQLLNDGTFSMVTDVVIAIPTSNGYVLYDVYNHSKERGGTLNVTMFGTWHKSKGLNISLTQNKFSRRANLHGMKLKVASIVLYKPEDVKTENYLQDGITRPQDNMSKFMYSLLLHMGDLFNFTMEIMDTNAWDTIEKNGTHSGMLGMLHQAKVDLGASPGAMLVERLHLAEIIGQVWPFRTCFIFRSTRWRIRSVFLCPLSSKSWYLIIVITVSATFVLASTLILEHINGWIKRCGTAAFLTIGILCQQGLIFVPKHLAGRVILVHLTFFSLLIYNYYSASVVSARLNNPFDRMNDSLNELAKSNLIVAAESLPYTNYYLTTSSNWEVRTFYAKRWSKISESKKYMSIEEGFKRVARGGFAYHTDVNTAYPYIERTFDDQTICELTEVHLFQPQLMAFWARRNGPFNEMARNGLAKIMSMGLRVRQIRRWQSRKPMCLQKVKSFQNVTLFETVPALILLIIGVTLAFGICIIENIVFKWYQIKRISDFNATGKNVSERKMSKAYERKLKSLQMFKIKKQKVLNLRRIRF